MTPREFALQRIQVGDMNGEEGSYRLTAEERRALLFVASFYPADPI